MEIKILVLLGLLSVFTSSVGAESARVRLLPFSMKGFVEGEGSRATLKNRSIELKERDKKGPLNVILVLVDELYRSDITTYFKNQDAFPVYGHLQTCPGDNIQESGSCSCEEKLGSSIASLLSWAQRVKGMTISVLYDVPHGISGPRVRVVTRQRRETPWVLQIENPEPANKRNIASKMTDTLFHSIVNGLSATQLPKPFIARSSNLTHVTSSVLKELSSTHNKSGYLVILRIEVNKLSSLLEFFKRHLSASNTLTVVTNPCLQGRSDAVPFFAGGFSSKRLFHHADSKQLHDLTVAIRTVIDQNNNQGVTDAKNNKPTAIFTSNELTASKNDVNNNIDSGLKQVHKRDLLPFDQLTDQLTVDANSKTTAQKYLKDDCINKKEYKLPDNFDVDSAVEAALQTELINCVNAQKKIEGSSASGDTPGNVSQPIVNDVFVEKKVTRTTAWQDLTEDVINGWNNENKSKLKEHLENCKNATKFEPDVTEVDEEGVDDNKTKLIECIKAYKSGGEAITGSMMMTFTTITATMAYALKLP